MRKEIKHYLQQWQSIYDGKPWYGPSLRTVLQGLDAETAYWKPRPGAHSIIELLHHILCWRRHFVQRLSGNLDFSIQLNSPEDWTAYEGLSEEKWKGMVKELEDNQKEITRLLNGKEDAFLEQDSGKGGITFRERLEGTIQHDLYHLGQMAMMKALYRLTPRQA
ncbi:MAG: DinB family protein [Lewinellaceae bacterium]|nr:DinB family protein [Phaeodactylibacter sp.]MCB9040186.1 DinB family protein [Lewinellaceae bacterium]